MSVCAKFQLPSLFRSNIKVPGGVVGWGVVEWGVVVGPILVFRLSLSQAVVGGGVKSFSCQTQLLLS